MVAINNMIDEKRHESRRTDLVIPRNLLFCGLAAIGFINGVSEKAGTAFEREGLLLSLFNTFGVSVIIWAAGVSAAFFLYRAEPRPAGWMDLAIALLASLCFLAPAPFLSWLGVSLIAAYLCLSSQPFDNLRKAGAILFALTIPMLWARILFAAASTTILEIDAKLVGWVVGTQSSGNTIPLADGSGVIFLEPSCSSLTNVSLAILCAVLFIKIQGLKWSPAAIGATVGACAATVLVNVCRISLIGLMPQYYTQIHGPIGALIASWLTIGALLWIFSYGIKTNAPAAA